MSDTPFALPDATLDVLRRRYAPKIDYTQDPVKWVEDTLPDLHLWSKQRQILESVRDNSKTSVQSAHGTGKSFLSSVATAWWLGSHNIGEAFVVTTAPTNRQVRAILWREIGRRFREGGFSGRVNQTEWFDSTNELIGFGTSPNDYDPTAFQGIHSRYILIVIDEACGVPKPIWDAASSLASNIHGKMLAIGNPDDPQSHFAKVCSSKTWNNIKISAFDTPNFTNEEVPEDLKEMLTSERYVEEQREELTEQSPVWVSKILGEFPDDALDGVIPYTWITQCQKSPAELEEMEENEVVEDFSDFDVEAGLDVAAGGQDSTIIYLRQGPKALFKRSLAGEKDPLVLADWLLRIIQDYDVKVLKVDANGVGWGVGAVIDNWHRDGKHDCIVAPVMVSHSATDDEHFLNLRAELWWAARERSRLKEWDLTSIDDKDVLELTAVRYHTLNPRARIQVEKKEDLRKRIGKSPDSADALLLAFHSANFFAEDFTEQVANFRLPR